jgi:hypothetical protein
MLIKHPRPQSPIFISANPMALATLTCTREGKTHLVEWTSVRKVTWKLNGRSYMRHVLDPILKEHLGHQMNERNSGLGLDLQAYDVGCRLVFDISVDGNDTNYFHVEG